MGRRKGDRTKPKYITESKQAEIIKLLADGHPVSEIERRTGVNHTSINVIKDTKTEDIANAKKEIIKRVDESHEEIIKQVAEDMLAVIRRIPAAITDDKIKACSAPQIATTAGILVDKYQLLTGGATANIHSDFKGRAEMEEFLKGKRIENSTGTESANNDKEKELKIIDFPEISKTG